MMTLSVALASGCTKTVDGGRGKAGMKIVFETLELFRHLISCARIAFFDPCVILLLRVFPNCLDFLSQQKSLGIFTVN